MPAVKPSLCLFSSFLGGDDKLVFGQIFDNLSLFQGGPLPHNLADSSIHKSLGRGCSSLCVFPLIEEHLKWMCCAILLVCERRVLS